MSQLDDGWTLESAPTETAVTRELTEQGRSRLELIRQALQILDGDAPDELELEGDGWSLLAPEAIGADAPRVEVAAPAPAPAPEVVDTAEPADSHAIEEEDAAPIEARAEPVSLGSLMVAMHDALDEALSDGWLASHDDAGNDSLSLTSEEEEFFAAGEQLALTSAPPEGEYADEPSRWKRLLRKSA